MSTYTPTRLVHVAGPVEADGRQRCLGCDRLLKRKEPYHDFGSRIGEILDYDNEGRERWIIVPIVGRGKGLKNGDEYCFWRPAVD